MLPVNKGRTKKDAEDYLPWAGFFTHPTEDAEVANRLPGWWQRERKFIREAVAAGRPYTLDDLQRLREGDASDKVPLHVPPGVSLTLLRQRFRATITPDEALNLLRAIVNQDIVLQRCTAFGDGRALLREQPLHGLFAYIWLVALYRRDVIPSVPVTALLELEDGIFNLLGEWVQLGGSGTAGLLLWLDSLVGKLLEQVA